MRTKIVVAAAAVGLGVGLTAHWPGDRAAQTTPVVPLRVTDYQAWIDVVAESATDEQECRQSGEFDPQDCAAAFR